MSTTGLGFGTRGGGVGDEECKKERVASMVNASACRAVSSPSSSSSRSSPASTLISSSSSTSSISWLSESASVEGSIPRTDSSITVLPCPMPVGTRFGLSPISSRISRYQGDWSKISSALR
ncbi:unnamed protein product [Mycena citricolor]|uniref:Uncharacterized protein n=1 Tax=Mycena citricolor TaxID=2018698 RepID=A0AAD2Q0Y4_9AGAR|nr:unnamed protein product [Mycena citricolor]